METKFTVEDDRAFLEEKLYTFFVREAGHKVVIDKYPDLYEPDDPVRYAHNLRLYELDNPDAFSDGDLIDIIEAARQKQIETGESTAAFWRGMTAEMTPEEIAAEELRRERNERIVSAARMLHKHIEPREALVSENGTPVFFASSLNMLWAYRGLGKSLVAMALAKLLTQGGEWLGFKSVGGYDVLLVDGELPAIQLQERVKEFVGEGRLSIWSPEFDPRFPDLGSHTGYKEFGRILMADKPRVIIFDTLTRLFKIDTNDAEQLLALNETLIDLRKHGFCVILIHHAGKNTTQRGRTDVDDNLDVSVKLDKPYGPGRNFRGRSRSRCSWCQFPARWCPAR